MADITIKSENLSRIFRSIFLHQKNAQEVRDLAKSSTNEPNRTGLILRAEQSERLAEFKQRFLEDLFGSDYERLEEEARAEAKGH
jgi:hypothetical protein